MLEKFKVTVKHDNGTTNLIVISDTGEDGAIRHVLHAENCPRSAIVKIANITNVLTATEKKYIKLIGENGCISAYHSHMAGNGGNTVGNEYLSRFIEPKFYTKGGDTIINAGRKLNALKK